MLILAVYMYQLMCDVPGGSHGNDREVTINVKRGVEAKNYGDVRLFIFNCRS